MSWRRSTIGTCCTLFIAIAGIVVKGTSLHGQVLVYDSCSTTPVISAETASLSCPEGYEYTSGHCYAASGSVCTGSCVDQNGQAVEGECSEGVCTCTVPDACAGLEECRAILETTGVGGACGVRQQCCTNDAASVVTVRCATGLVCVTGAGGSGVCVALNPSAPDEQVSTASSVCGNGIVEPPEECDDSNRRDNDGCSTTCRAEVGMCGDGTIQRLLGEQCEPSLHDENLPYDCVECRFLSHLCGDGNLDEGEECDEGPGNSDNPNTACRLNCSYPRCGDGIIDDQFDEQCDDGNRLNEDGCNRYCIAEQLVPIRDNNPLPLYQLPLAQVEPFIPGHAPIGDTGPAAVAVIVSGIAAGLGFVRQKRK
ncbi:DUF4215 domain-containing protein [Candidatus Peribacteria bacterium]|nr:DUF4215 domain-containing protein [Candidatus Peribacteria bacterium]